jgi:plastocyanin
MRGGARRLALGVAWWLALLVGGADGQSTLERGPNLEGVWVPPPAVVQFNLLHRFELIGDAQKLVNYPTLVLAAGLPGSLMLGSRYASNSLLVGGRPNEWELFGRWAPLRESRGNPLDLGLQVARNGPARSMDGELLVARSLGPFRGLLGARAFSAYRGEGAELALLAGAVLRLGRHAALAGDVAGLPGVSGSRAAWSAGAQLQIPYTPHFLSLHVTNATATTLQGATLGMTDLRWGFEFTVPLTLRRSLASYSRAERRAVEPPPGAPVGATVDMDNLMRFLPDTVRIAAGESVRWRNGSDIVHTVTADPDLAELAGSVRLPVGVAAFDSGDLHPGEEFVHVFDEPGEYTYFCIPHERAGMVGTIIVDGRRQEG